MAQAVTDLKIKLTTAGVEKLPQLSRAFSAFGRDVKKADLNFKEFGKELKKHQSENVRSINNTRALANTWKELAASVEFGSKEFKEATLEAQRLNRELQKMEGVGRKGRFGAAAKIAGTAAGATVFGGPLGGAGAIIGGVAGGVEGAVTGGVYGAMGVRRDSNLRSRY